MTFLRWVGSKRKIVHKFKDMFPDIDKCRGYIEPFLGGGSVFYYVTQNYNLEGKPIYLSDINKELIITYRVVRDKLDELIPLLETHQKLNNKEYFDKMRKIFPPGDEMTDIEKAASFIYLSKCVFGSKWVVNSHGKLSTTYRGNEGENIFDDNIFLCSKLLQGTKINYHPFDRLLEINKGDLKDWFVYCCLSGTKIRMLDERLLNVEDVKIGDKTFMGGNVVSTFERDYNGKIYEFEAIGIYDNLCVTEEHPLAIIRQKDAYQIFDKYPGGRMHMSKFKNHEVLNRLDIKFIRSKDINIGDFLLVPCYQEKVLDVKNVKIGSVEVKCDENFGYIIGFWLAEGHIEHYYGKNCISKDRLDDIRTGKQSTLLDMFDIGHDNDYDSSYILEYSCGKLDFDHGFIDRLDKWYDCYFKITGSVRKLPWECLQISYHIEDLAKFLHKNFGEGAENKKISNEILNYPLEFQKGLLRGWLDGDGGIWGDERNRCKVTGTSVSKQLALDMYLIALRLGLRPALKSRKSKLGNKGIHGLNWDIYFASQDDVKYLYPDCHDFVNSKTRSQRRIIVKGNKKFILTPITKIIKKEYDGKVYNLTTENNVYIANYVLSHNCDPPYYDVGVKDYAKDKFSRDTKEKIRTVFEELDKRGAKVMMSNSDGPTVYSYFKNFNINVIDTGRVADTFYTKYTKRERENVDTDIKEVIVTNYKPIKKQKTIDEAWSEAWS